MVTRRLNRIFQPDGRALSVACDQGLIPGPAKGIEVMERTLTQMIERGVKADVADALARPNA